MTDPTPTAPEFKAREVRREPGSPFAPWAGAIGAAIGSAVQQQGLGSALRFDCAIDAPRWGGISAGIALLFILAGAFVSWRVYVAGADASNEYSSRRFIASLSLLAAALATGVVAFMTLATVIVPPCPP